MNASGATSEGSAAKTLYVMIMNACGPGNAKKKKDAIEDCIRTHNPDLVLFQEFRWKQPQWLNDHFPDYNYDGHEEASIFYKRDKLNVEKIIDSDLQDICDQFNALDRISVHIIVSKEPVPHFNFVCLSWHGEYRTSEKYDEFGTLMELAENIYDEYELPILLGGDFNINIENVPRLEDSFMLNMYRPSARRKNVGVKDFFIITEALDLSGTKPVNLNDDSSAALDHDPIIGQLEQTNMSDRARQICALLSELEALTSNRPTYPRTTNQLDELKVQHEFQCLCKMVDECFFPTSVCMLHCHTK